MPTPETQDQSPTTREPSSSKAENEEPVSMPVALNAMNTLVIDYVPYPFYFSL